MPKPGMLIGIRPTRHIENGGDFYIDDHMRRLMNDAGVKGFDTSPDNVGGIKGDSWEMAAVMAIKGKPGTYSGTLVEYKDGKARFGPVRGVDVKRKLHTELKTCDDVSEVRVSPGV